MKQIIVGTTTICGEGFWTAAYVDNQHQVVGSTVPEAIGCLVGKEFDVIYTDAAKEKIEKIQKIAAQMDSATHLLNNQDKLDAEAREFYRKQNPDLCFE